MDVDSDVLSPKELAAHAAELLRDFGSLTVPESLEAFRDAFYDTDDKKVHLVDAIDAVVEAEGRTPESAARDVMMFHQMSTRWASFGMPVFELTHSLAAMLLLTEEVDDDLTAFAPPYPTFCLRLPSNMGFTSGVTQHVLQTSWLHRTEIQGVVGLAVKASGRGNYTSESLTVVRPGMKVIDWVDQGVAPSDDGIQLGAPALHSLQSVRRLLANFSAWVTGNPASLQRSGRWKRAPQQDRPEAGVPSTWIAGREIKLDRDIVAAARTLVEHESGAAKDGSLWRLKSRYVVRGHWRNQATGPGRQERTRMWIAPHWKGPRDSKEAWSHVYKAAVGRGNNEEAGS